MWCHICKRGFTNYEDFKVHIMKVHREASDYEDDSDSDSKSDDDFITLADHDDAEEDDVSSNINTDLNAYISINAYANTNINTNANVITHTNNDVNMNSTVNKKMEKALSKVKLNVAKKLKAKSLKHNKRKVTSRPVLKLLPKGKRALRRSTRVHRKSSYQEDNSSDDNTSPTEKKAMKESNEQTAKTHGIDQENKKIIVIDPVLSQGVNNYVVGNQGVQQPMFVINPIIPNTAPDSVKSFDFTSDNILKWLYKYRDLTRTLKFPLPQSLFDHIKSVHKGIFDHYCLASSGEETPAVMKVYEDLTHMIHRHILSINEKL